MQMERRPAHSCVDVHAHDRDVAEAAIHWSLRTLPVQPNLRVPIKSNLLVRT